MRRQIPVLGGFCPFCLRPNGERFNVEFVGINSDKLDKAQLHNSTKERNGLRIYDLKRPGEKCKNPLTCPYLCMVCGEKIKIDDEMWVKTHKMVKTQSNIFGNFHLKELAKATNNTYVKDWDRVVHLRCSRRADCGCSLPKGMQGCSMHADGDIKRTSKRLITNKRKLKSDSEEEEEEEEVFYAPVPPPPPLPPPPSAKPAMSWDQIMKKMKPDAPKNKAKPKSNSKPKGQVKPVPGKFPPYQAKPKNEPLEHPTIEPRCAWTTINDRPKYFEREPKKPIQKPTTPAFDPKIHGYVMIKGELCYRHPNGTTYHNATGVDNFGD